MPPEDDTTITKVPEFPHAPERGGTVTVYTHTDGGVTLLRRDHRGTETARLSFMRETWALVLSAAMTEDTTSREQER